MQEIRIISTGHVSYVPGTEAFKQIAEEFGSEVVGSDGQIDRKSLGKIVFSTKVRYNSVFSDLI